MKQDTFGNIMYEGKLVNVDTEDIKNLEEISKKLKEKNKILEEKVDRIFKQ